MALVSNYESYYSSLGGGVGGAGTTTLTHAFVRIKGSTINKPRFCLTLTSSLESLLYIVSGIKLVLIYG